MKLTLRLTPERLKELLFALDGEYRTFTNEPSQTYALEVRAFPDGRLFVTLSEQQEARLSRQVTREELRERWESK